MTPRPWTTLVPPQALREALGDDDVVLLDCRHVLTDPEAGPRLYDEGHIPGALHAHCDRDLAAPVTSTTGRHPLPEPARFQATLGAWGIGPDTQVVVYDDAGGAWAARAWWLLRHYGHRQVALLDGGLQAYVADGGTLTRDIPPRQAQRFVGGPGHMPVVTARSFESRLPLADGTLLDARDAARYRGEVEPIDAVAGHIPGAANLPFKSLLDANGRLRPADELRVMFAKATGDRPAEQVAVYCGSGVTSALLVMAMEHAGLGTPALYVGSWSEWIRGGHRPVARTA